MNRLRGSIAVAAGLVVAQLLSSFNKNLNSPVVSIGNRVIDHVPANVKSFAIRTFGVDDKRALVITIYAIVFLLSLAIGQFYFRAKRMLAFVLICAMTALATAAALFDAKANSSTVLPSLAAGISTVFFLRALDVNPQAENFQEETLTRRDLIKRVGYIGVGAAAALTLGNFVKSHASAQLQRLKVVLPKPLKSLPPPPKDPALVTPGLSPLITPNKDFYRIDTAIVVPSIDVETWRLQITGMVRQPRTYTYKEISARPVFELDDTIACVSNEVGGNLVGNARWLGVRLDDLVKEASPFNSADQVMGYSDDGFSAGFPLAALDGRDAMIAIGMNGEPLPLEHGFPARIIVPGLYGYVSATKWLTKIELTRFDKAEGYWVPRGWSAQAPIKTQSRIDTPIAGSVIKSGTRAIAGVAWAPTRGISKVEVKIGQAPWRPATLGPALAKTTWRQWWIDWDATSGAETISVRATDGTGELQTSVPAPVEPNGAQGWHTISVTVAT